MINLRLFVRSHAFLTAFAGVVLLWLALPPVEWWGLAFLAPVPWCVMIFERRKAKRFYRSLYLAGVLFWLFEVHFVRYPHPVNYVLLLLLAGYMGVYLPLFVAVSRNLVHGRWRRMPRVFAVMVAAPAVYMACELLRGWVFTGYLMGSLCHALYRVPLLIQTADIMGEVGVTGLMILLSAAGGLAIYAKNTRAAAVFALTLTFMLAYGFLNVKSGSEDSPYSLKVALIQGNIPAVLELDPETTKNTESQYFQLTTQAVTDARAAGQPLSLVVWPESIYRHPVIFADADAVCPPGVADEHGEAFTQERFEARLQTLTKNSQLALRSISSHYGTPFVTGGGAEVFTATGHESYNAALYVRQGEENVQFYAKMHLVPFGEYVPFLRTLAAYVPGVAELSPIGAGSGAGRLPASFAITDAETGEVFHATPSVCFESVVGRLIRRQVAELEKAGTRTDFLLNVTNNGWFRNSHESRLHLACGVFRAVENRKKLLIAANYGISADISPAGVILDEAVHGKPAVLVANVSRNDVTAYKTPCYTRWGHWLIFIPLAIFATGVVCKNSSRERK